jgi:hypothetical protein
MLSTSNLSAAQAETYYTKEDYYSSEEKAHPTKWMGKGAVARIIWRSESARLQQLAFRKGSGWAVVIGKSGGPGEAKSRNRLYFQCSEECQHCRPGAAG